MSALSKVRGVNIRKDDTRRMEDEARMMELKMEMLRKTLDCPDSSRTGVNGGSENGSRWRSGTAKKPIRTGYVKDVLETKPTRPSQGKQPRGDAGARPRDAVPENTLPPFGGNLAASRGESARTTPRQAEAQGTFGSVLAGTVAPALTADRASSNLQAAMQHQSREALEVEAFLAGLGLDRYVSLFNEHGFDCMEVVREMQESHMRDIGMAAGHALKLRKRLAELNPAPAPAPAPTPAAAAATQSGSLPSTTQKRVSFGQTEEAKVRSPSGTGTGAGGGSLLDGHYDEAAQNSAFQDAVRAWREGCTPDEGQPAKVEAAATTPKALPGSFWSGVGAGDVNLERCSTPVTTPAGTMTSPSETQHDPAPSEEKLCCYQCYKQFFARYAVERRSQLGDQTPRRLCSDVCANLWMATQQAKANEVQTRHERLAKLEEMKRAMDYELQAAQVETGAEPAVAA